MAFRASELRLILGIQAYGTTNFARLRRDIQGLARTADLANLNQSRVQDQIVAKRAQVAATTRRIANLEARMAASRNVLEARGAVAAERFAQRRLVLQQREFQAMETMANRRIQIGRTQDRIAAMGDSGMQKFAVAEAQLAQRRQSYQNQINTLDRQGISLSAQRLRNLAAQEAAMRKLGVVGGQEALAQPVGYFTAIDTSKFPELSRLKEAGLRYHAVRVDAERIAAAQSHLPGQIAAVNAQLAVAAEQEKLIGMRRYEQAAAIGRQTEYLQVQQASLQTIEARLESIQAEEKVITAQESLTNAERTKALAALNAETAELQIQKTLLGEQLAEYQLLSGEALKRAAAADAAAVKMAKTQQLETTGRTIAHAGRVAQFAGLIATGGFLAASNAAADFNKNAALAGTQMRDVSASFAQATVRGQGLEKEILRLMQRFPATAEEMSNSAYEIFSSMNIVRNGIVNVAEGYRLLATANRMAVAGQVDLEEATSAMITTLNNFDPNLQHVNKTMNEAFAIIRFGQMRLNDFAEAMVPLAPIAKTTGLALTDVGSALAALTIVFRSPRQAAQGLARAIELLNLDAFRKGLHEVGVEVLDSHDKMRPLYSIIRDLAKAFPEATTGQKAIVRVLTEVSKASGMTKAGIQGTVQARRALGELITSMALYRNILSNVSSNQNEFNNAYAAMRMTPGVQWAVFVNQMRAFALVIGRAALPVMLELGDKLIAAAHWIENLTKKTNGAIIRWIAWGAVGALLVGTFANVAGSALAMVANFRIATGGMLLMEGAATKATIATRLLLISLKLLAGVGLIAIPIVLQIMKGGEPGLWDFLGGALSGAAGGAMIGSAIAPGIGTAIGAGIGAITVPLAIKFVDTHRTPTDPIQAEYDRYKKSFKYGSKIKGRGAIAAAQPMPFEEWAKNYKKNLAKFKIPAIGEDVVRRAGPGVKKTKTLLQQYNELFKMYSKQWLQAQEDMLNALAGEGTDGGKKADQAAKLAKERARLQKEAWQQMQQDIKNATQQIGQIYDQFLQQNKQTFGELGQGPVMTGFLGQIYSGLNDLLMQFGQTIPIPIQLINRDLEMQISNFDKLRQGYAQLLQKGVPLEVVQEIQKMGMAGLPFVQGLVRATGPEFRKFLQNVKTRQKEIEKYTKIDFTNQLNQWKKYGSDIATAIIGGLSTEAAQAVIKGGFDKYVMQVFGKSIRENAAKTIEEGMKAAREQIAAENAADKAKAADAKKAAAAAKAARNKLAKSGKVSTTTTKGTGTATTPATVSGPNIFSALNPGFLKPAPRVIINNNGERTVIHADGVHPKKVKQAINKKGFETRNRRR